MSWFHRQQPGSLPDTHLEAQDLDAENDAADEDTGALDGAE
jgi:hypothetical protein